MFRKKTRIFQGEKAGESQKTRTREKGRRGEELAALCFFFCFFFQFVIHSHVRREELTRMRRRTWILSGVP